MKALKTIQEDFYKGLKAFFEELQIPINYLAEEPANPKDILSTETFNSNNVGHQLMEDVYFLGIVNDDIFQEKETFQSGDEFKKAIKKDYDGIVLLGITLKDRGNGLLPTRSHLADITRAFNREFKYTPVTIIFKYGNYISFANSERLKYKQEWREGEKAGKVTILRDIKTENTHSGHLRILQRLEIKRSGTKAVTSYADLYKYWQEVLSVSVLNKSFYEELSNWYFWAIKSVRFPGEPKKEADEKEADFLERTKAHRAQNVIRLITRLMFSWFIKEKHLINAQLFDESELKEIVDLGKKNGSNYYKAILQNLFFATLNQEMDKRAFRRDGQNYNVTNLFRYKNLFKDEQKALALFKDIPFLNGGLFECLDKPGENGKVERIDGFSDRDDNVLSVPNELFFGSEQEEDLSEEYGLKGKKYAEAKVKGLITLLNSYVFTVTENTPVEEDVALDPELLGKVFENLLASYNPETKTTARKQTGSFYTPREIVNYMVDESLIAYLKNELLKEEEGYLEVGKEQGDIFGNSGRKGQLKIENKLDKSPWAMKEAELDESLHQLFSFDDIQPFTEETTKTKLIEALDKCTILDPACGSGAFPMGVLQKMVHVLQKLDPRNERWKERQLARARQIEDPDIQQKLIEDIEEAFENNELDYGRKLYLIENCIYGVDIQPIATQISKLRFFISLIVDQKINDRKENLGIRPLPNLETKFVAANTLVGLERPQQMVLRNPEIEKKEHELNEVRHRHFSAKTPKTKNKWRIRDKELREEIAELLKNDGWGDNVANQVAEWDPYDQNIYADFFDREWMFDMASGFDVVLGNPPYRPIQKYDKEQKSIWSKQGYEVYANSGNVYFLFFEKALEITRQNGVVSFITSNQWMRNNAGKPLRKLFLNYNPEILVDFRGTDIFENVAVLSNIMILTKRKSKKALKACDVSVLQKNYEGLQKIVYDNSIILNKLDVESWLIFSKKKHSLREEVVKKGIRISDWSVDINYGIKTGFNDAFYLTESEKDNLLREDPKNKEIIKPMLRGKDLGRYYPKEFPYFLIFSRRGIDIDNYPSVKNHLFKFYDDLKPKSSSKEKQGRKPGTYKWYELQDAIVYHEKFYQKKMIFMNMTKDLIFSYDPEGEFLTNQKCFIVTGNHIKYLTAFFNSKFFAYFFKDNFPELLGDVREVSKVYFEKIPVAKPTTDQINCIESIVDIIIYHKKEELKSPVSFELILEGLIAELYFQEHMKEQSIDISSQVKADLNRFLPQNFESLEPSQQDSVIKHIHSEWSHPDNVIRNRTKEFAIKSPDILKPILES